MLESLQYFFRSVPDQPRPMPPLVHIALLVIWLVVVFLLIERGHQLAERPRLADRLLKVMASVLLLDFVLMNGWMIFSHIFNAQENLSLFHCRMATILLIISIFFKRKKIIIPGMWWGLMGSVATLIVAETYPYNFPHYSNFNFVIMHFLIGWISVYMVAVKGYRYPTKDLFFMLKVTNLYNLFLLMFNLTMHSFGLTQTNYGYINEPPLPLAMLYKSLGPIGYILFSLMIYNVIMLLTWILGRFVLVPLVSKRQAKIERATVRGW